MNKLFKNFSDGNKLKKFFDDKEKVTTQFKALHGYGGSVSNEERKQFHLKNYRRAFSVCRNALDEYAKRGANATRKKDGEDVKRPCEIMEALSRLCQDIPHLVKQNWNHNALSELFSKFLNFNTNEEIRLKCITFIFVVINAAKDSSHKKYVECLKYSADFTPFCIEAPYENYYNNFKKNLIVAQDALPWTRTGPTNKNHCIAILNALLGRVKDAADFHFWYLYMTKHIFPQLYHGCTCNNAKLVAELYSDDQKHELDRVDNIEKEGFGSVGPPPQIQSLFSEWFCGLLQNADKNKIMLSKKIYILYGIDMFKYSMKLPISEVIPIYNMLKRIEKWFLGIDLTNTFKEEIQNYYQMIITHLFGLFEIPINELSTKNIHKKLNIISYAIYLLRLISGEPYIKLSPKTWKILIDGIVSKIKYYQTNKHITNSKQKQQQELIEERIVHPLIHCLFKSFILMSISDTKTGNILLTQFKVEISSIITYEPLVIQWREIMRNMTIELLGIISPKVEEKEKNYDFHQTNTSKNKSKAIPNQSLEMNSDSYVFSIENRLKKLKIDIFEFRGLDEAFMIWDRLLHLLGAPLSNPSPSTRQTHLEGFCDSLKIFVSALGIKEHTAARKKKQEAMELMKQKQKAQQMKQRQGGNNDGNPPNNTQYKIRPKKSTTTATGISRMGNSIYGFPHSLISVPIDVSKIALEGNMPASIRKNLPLPPREQLPQGDTLIKIFGPWLFDICIHILVKSTLTEQVNRLNEFRMAFGCLSDIFLTNCEITFDDLYLSTFYRIIKLSFGQKVSQKIRAMVIQECAKGCIFGKNLTGVNCLINEFIECMKSIVGYDGTNKSSKKYAPKKAASIFSEQEANDSLTIAMSLICFAAHFDKVRINSFPTESDGNKSANNNLTFSQIKSTITDVFSYIAHFDNLPVNVINTVIWGSVLIIYDEVSSSKDIKIIQTAMRSITDGTNINKLEMAKIATRAIESLSPICDQICEIDSQLISKNLFQPFLANIQEFVKKAGNRDIQTGPQICKICTHQIYCCLEWMFRFPPNVLANDQVMVNYFKMLHSALCLQAKLPTKRSLHQNVSDKNPLADLVLAAVTSKMMLFHYLGNFPLPHDSGAISSNASDDYRGSQEGNVFLSYDSNTLITANDRILAHQAGPEPGVRFLLRDESGKFAWNFTPCSIQSKPILNDNDASNIRMILPQNAGKSKSEKYVPKYARKNNNNNKNSKSSSNNNKKNDGNVPPPPSLDNVNKKQQLPPPPSVPEQKSNDAFLNSFNENLTKIKEKHANVFKKGDFTMNTDANNKQDGLKQVLNYVSRELTPPAGKVNKQITYNKKKQIISSSSSPKGKDNDKNNGLSPSKTSPSKISSARQKRTNSGSFPSGHLSDKSRAKLAKYMDEQKKEEMDLYRQYQKLREQQMAKLQKLQAELAKEEEKKEDGGIKHALNDMKIREAVTGFDCSRFLLGHFGILTPGHVLGVKDSLFSDVTSDDINDSKTGKDSHSNHRRARPMSPPTNRGKQYATLRPQGVAAVSSQMRHQSFSGRQNSKPKLGGQYRLDPYLYSLDQNLLAMFGNKDNAFHRRLRLLDQSSFEREKHKIGVVYVGPDQDEQRLILANESGSLSYRRFIDKLGWKVDLLQHQGFNGAMNASTTGRYCNYYCTATYEMAFHIATTMPTNHNDQQQTEKKKHIGNDQVNIIWTDNGREYIIDTIYSHFNQVQIVIYPLNNGLYRIKIHKKKDVGYFGPLLNNMILRESLLSILVRITSLYANRTVRYAASVYTRPFVERKKYLDEAIDKNSHRSHESILGAFFPYMASK